MKVYLLDGGSIVIDHAQLMWNIGSGTEARIPSYSVLIEHREGLFLFDTGFDLDHVNRVLPWEKPLQEPAQTIPAQLELAGFAPGDVTHVINSHLHFDHVGGNKHLPDAVCVVHADELREARTPEPFERFGYSDLSFDTPETRYELIEGDVEFADGVTLLHTPGHTIGHYSLLLEPPGRAPMFFISDVTYTAAGLERTVQPGFHWNPVEGVRAIRRVRRVAKERQAEVFFSHDAERWETDTRAPQSYGSA
jgi:4-pyridoxolactonase